MQMKVSLGVVQISKSTKKKMSKRLRDVRKAKKDVRGFDETYYSAGEKDDIERELDEYETYLMNRRKGLTNREIEVVMGMDRGYYKGENWQGTRNYGILMSIQLTNDSIWKLKKIKKKLYGNTRLM